MIIKNIKVYTEDKTFADGKIIIREGVFEEIIIGQTTASDLELQDTEIVDGKGCYAIPGLIDIHFHGCMGDDFCDGTKEAIARIAEYEASIGVTAMAPATMTLPVEELEQILKVAAEYKKGATKGADLIGINMEGPFISSAKKGAQDEKNMILCDTEVCQRFLNASDGLVKFVGIAPEESENSLEFIEKMKDKVNISLAHTNADYDTAKAAFDAGANHADRKSVV